jgi:hypothetical protein
MITQKQREASHLHPRKSTRPPSGVAIQFQQEGKSVSNRKYAQIRQSYLLRDDPFGKTGNPFLSIQSHWLRSAKTPKTPRLASGAPAGRSQSPKPEKIGFVPQARQETPQVASGTPAGQVLSITESLNWLRSVETLNTQTRGHQHCGPGERGGCFSQPDAS